MSAHARRPHPATRALAGVGVASLVLLGARFITNFLGPRRAFYMRREPALPLDSPEFIQFLSVITNGAVRPARLERLHNGSEFYPAELDAIRAARHSVNLEFYEFLDGCITRQILTALIEAAQRGVHVRVLVDAIGSISQPTSLFDSLRAAGGQFRWYHPIASRTWPDFNNRTHRKLIVIDGRVGFIGGAGIADHWLDSTPQEPAWRDTMFRVEGQAVLGLISTFAENWLEAAGEILCGPRHFPPIDPADTAGKPSFVVLSTPKGGATQGHVLFQALIQSAQRTIQITTPYFLPDRSDREALIAARRRGVDVQIVTAGPKIDHKFIRRMTRRSARRLVASGARLFEYQPSMIHAKTMTVDGCWCIIGSTNFDHRSFALNDEVNLAVLDPALAATLDQDFAADKRLSQQISLAALPRPGVMDVADGAVDEVAEQVS